VLRSFFFAGFEGSTGYNVRGEWIDQIAATQHDRFAEEDYERLAQIGVHTVREAVRWPLVDRRGRHDFASVRPFVWAARRKRIEVIWDLFHFGFPEDVDLFSDEMPERFADYAYAVARYVAAETDGPHWFTPVNEPSYFAWAAGDAALFAPHARGRGDELKLQLARAGLRAVDALRAGCPDAGIVTVDAICRVVPPEDRPDLADEAEAFNRGAVFQSLDYLAGALCPELGGSRDKLGVVGVNYYWTNQWELGRAGEPLSPADPRHQPLRSMVRDVWQRYGGPLIITETGHVGERRAGWLRHVSDEAEALLAEGVPLRGVCLYPILGMPEWHAREVWTRMGLWDLVPQSPTLGRVAHLPMLAALRDAQARRAAADRAAQVG
jgi:beta-glucosidase/6-phospho-beta-glucosidase/beta-galactosidase